MINQKALENICLDLLVELGEDINREGLADTPRRWASMWREFMTYDPGVTDTCFESQGSGQIIVVSGMRVWSFCEHHLLPFWCDVSIGYIPDGQVLGLSKFARIAHQQAHKLQLQERLCQQIADQLQYITKSDHVAVLARGEHLCMSMRGVKTPALMSSLVTRGAFKTEPDARDEFLRLAQGGM